MGSAQMLVLAHKLGITVWCCRSGCGRRLQGWSSGIDAAVRLSEQYGEIAPTRQHAFVLAMAVFSAVLLALGVLRHYWDIYVHRTVRGISWGFVFLDAAGDLTSMLAIRRLQSKSLN